MHPSTSQLPQPSLSLASDEDDEYDYFDEDEPDEPQHHFLDGHTALKFLFAGVIAGAGTLSIPSALQMNEPGRSLTDVYCTLRSTQNISYYATA